MMMVVMIESVIYTTTSRWNIEMDDECIERSPDPVVGRLPIAVDGRLPV